MKISEKYIVEIGTFLENYYMLGYTWKETLTHDVFSQFLHQKGRRSVRLIFSNIQKEDILTGECIFVRDAVGKIIPYQNPLRVLELEYLNQDSEKLKQIRERLLRDQGFEYDENDEIVPIEKDKQIVKIGGKNDKY